MKMRSLQSALQNMWTFGSLCPNLLLVRASEATQRVTPARMPRRLINMPPSTGSEQPAKRLVSQCGSASTNLPEDHSP